MKPLYSENGRPQFHFSQKSGWNNDVNGMVYSDGLYHLSWQCNPTGLGFGSMYWGHAVSKDLVHWAECSPVIRVHGGKSKDGKADVNLHPSMAIGLAYSGSTVVDHNNTLGKQLGATKTLIACFTDTGAGIGTEPGVCGESLAYSTDNGRSYTLLRDYNPIISHFGRDPNLFWYEPGKHWCIVVYNGGHAVTEPKGWIGKMEFYSSKDLRTWTLDSTSDEVFHECPELVELPVDGNAKTREVAPLRCHAEVSSGNLRREEVHAGIPGHASNHGRLDQGGAMFQRCPGGPGHLHGLVAGEIWRRCALQPGVHPPHRAKPEDRHRRRALLRQFGERTRRASRW